MSISKKLMETLKEEVKSASYQVEESYHKLVALFPLQSIVTKDQHAIALKVIERLIFLLIMELKMEELKYTLIRL